MKEKKVVILSRKALVTIIGAWFILFVLVILSFQYANYVDRRSNRHWCGIVETLTSSYKKRPPDSEIGKLLQTEFQLLQQDWCR